MSRNLLPVMVLVALSVAVIDLLAFKGKDSGEEKTVQGQPGNKVEVLYFHLTRRCVTCQAVENVSRDAVAEMYPA